MCVWAQKSLFLQGGSSKLGPIWSDNRRSFLHVSFRILLENPASALVEKYSNTTRYQRVDEESLAFFACRFVTHSWRFPAKHESYGFSRRLCLRLSGNDRLLKVRRRKRRRHYLFVVLSNFLRYEVRFLKWLSDELNWIEYNRFRFFSWRPSQPELTGCFPLDSFYNGHLPK